MRRALFVLKLRKVPSAKMAAYGHTRSSRISDVYYSMSQIDIKGVGVHLVIQSGRGVLKFRSQFDNLQEHALMIDCEWR